MALASRRLLFRPITVIEARPLRDAVLRAGHSPGGSIYPGDEQGDSLHLGAFVNGGIVAVATVLLEQMPFSVQSNGWRLRGMATLPNFRGLGIGRQLAEFCIRHSEKMGGSYLWCSARVASKRFYSALGLVESGEVFRLPRFSDTSYVLMHRQLSSGSFTSSAR